MSKNGTWNLPVLGLGLAVDALDRNGVAPAVIDLLSGESAQTAYGEIQNSRIARDPLGQSIDMALTWSAYGIARKMAPSVKVGKLRLSL